MKEPTVEETITILKGIKHRFEDYHRILVSEDVAEAIASLSDRYISDRFPVSYTHLFQALMPTIGFFLGTQFKDQITSIDHWIAFVLLGLIGINMVKEALSNDEEQADDSIAVKEMFMLAVATSIDALAVGITFAFLNVHIVSAASMIGVCTFLISFAGVKIGNIFGTKYKSKAELAGRCV